MTFTCMARDAATGELGIATATRSLAVGSRVTHVSRRGAVAIMAIADSRLGRLAQNLLANECPAPAVIAALAAADSYPEYRQLGVIDAAGGAAARTGAENRDFRRPSCARRADWRWAMSWWASMCWMPSSGALPARPWPSACLPRLEAGRDAGGQHGGQNSAALVVWGEHDFAQVDLRVDVHAEPVGELRRVFDAWKPAAGYYTDRQLDPRVRPLHEALPGKGY